MRWDWPHSRYIQAKLDQVTDGIIRRLMIFSPPQHGKTELSSVSYAAYRMERDPGIRIGLITHTQRHSLKISRSIRKIVRERIGLSLDDRAIANWSASNGSSFLAAGVGGAIVGQPFDLLLIDDVTAKRRQMLSETYKANLWSWYSEEVYTRLQKGAPIILTNTRWALDDLPGRILSLPNWQDWHIVKLPAIAKENDPIGRSVGEALCPDLHPIDELLDARITLGILFECVFGCEPTDPEGNMLKLSHVHRESRLTGTIAGWCRFWDTANTEDGGCYTVGVLGGKAVDKTIWVADVERMRHEYEIRNQRMLAVAKQDRETYGDVIQVVEQEPAGGGKEAADRLVRMFRQNGIRAEAMLTNKASKFERFSDVVIVAAQSRLHVMVAHWTPQYLTELAAFPFGHYMDQADATSGLIKRLDAGPVNKWYEAKARPKTAGQLLAERSL